MMWKERLHGIAVIADTLLKWIPNSILVDSNWRTENFANKAMLVLVAFVINIIFMWNCIFCYNEIQILNQFSSINRTANSTQWLDKLGAIK